MRIKIPKNATGVAPLPMGGSNPQGVAIGVNSRYLTLDGKPWLPVMGEFHFSRCPAEDWEDELRKMKAGGITIAATYVFWIHIEENEGQFDWSGRRDLRRFTELCAKVGLYAYPRIGPWAHGECRNGGFPDWLLERCGSAVRQDAARYLSYVRRFFVEIQRQLNGLLWQDGGPVVGIQIENELLDNPAHIITLKRLAREVGLDVPIYTMTGWGPARIPDGQEVIPVFGGYPDAFWERQVEVWARGSRKHYFFSHLRDDNAIGADLRQQPGTGDLSRLEEFPYGTCETGGGMQVAYHRRPLIASGDVAALALVKVGSGSNLLGYYMYHGGANPDGRNTSMQESQATGYPNDLPVINYDFKAPLGQYGQIRPVYHALRPLHLFLQDFGADLAPLPMTLPEAMPPSLDDRETLRWAVRSDGEQGFLFINNYQRIEGLPDHADVQFTVEMAGERLRLPAAPVTIPAGLTGIWPLNMALGAAQLKYATAQPLCRLAEPNGPTYIFFAQEGVPPEFVFEAGSLIRVEGPSRQGRAGQTVRLADLTPGPGCLLQITTRGGETVRILVLSAAEARQAYKAEVWGQERLILSEDGLVFDENSLRIQTRRAGMLAFSVYPGPGWLEIKGGAEMAQAKDGVFARYEFAVSKREIAVEALRTQAAGPARVVLVGPAGVAQAPGDEDFEEAETWQLRLAQDAFTGVNEVFLRVEYTGDAARAYIGERLIDDDFYHTREAWEIGLRRFLPEVLAEGVALKVLPIRKDALVYLDERARLAFGEEEAVVRVEGISAVAQNELEVVLPVKS